MARAHRHTYATLIQPIPAGLDVCHHCDNPPCVRPSHLFTGTDADNSADKVRKGRRNDARGERNGSAKMTAAKVLEMRRLAREGMTQWAIARRFGVGQSQVSRIIQRNLWAHI